MDVWIARDGVEIGAWRQQDLNDLARSGNLQPTDYYWRVGMEEWEFLESLIGADAWKAPEPPRPALSHWQYALLTVGGLCAVGVFFAIIALLVRPASFSPAVKGQTQPFSALPTAKDPSRTDAKLRDTAVAELVAKLNKLPTAASPPLNLFYYALKVVFPEPPGALIATVTGAEDVVDPATQKTLWHTPFILMLDYRDGRWMYRDYRASTTDMSDGTVMEIDGSRKAAIQPTIVSILGVKAAPDRIEHE